MSTLIDDIRAYLAATGMKPGTFGTKAANDGKLVARLSQPDRECLPRTERRIRQFMADNPPKADRSRETA